MRFYSLALAGVIAAIASLAAGDSAVAAIIVSDFESVSPIPSGLTGSPTDLNGDGVLFSGIGNTVVDNGGLGVPYGNNSLLANASITMSAPTATFDFVNLNVNALSAGTLTVNGNPFAFGAGSTLLAVGLFNVNSVNISSSVANTMLDNIRIDTIAAAAVPEPASAAFLGLGSLALVVRRLRRRSSVVA